MSNKKWQVVCTEIINDHFWTKTKRTVSNEREAWIELEWILEGFNFDCECDRVLIDTVRIIIDPERKEMIIWCVDASALRHYHKIYEIKEI